jgi:hypothetical protein
MLPLTITTGRGEQVKATIDGTKYDTDKATLLAVAEYRGSGSEKLRDALYRTRRAQFFEVSNATFDGATKSWRKGGETVRALTPREAEKWVDRKGAEPTEHFARYLGQLPEDQAGKAASTIVRLTLGLKVKVERKALERGISLNDFICAALERATK